MIKTIVYIDVLVQIDMLICFGIIIISRFFYKKTLSINMVLRILILSFFFGIIEAWLQLTVKNDIILVIFSVLELAYISWKFLEQVNFFDSIKSYIFQVLCLIIFKGLMDISFASSIDIVTECLYFLPIIYFLLRNMMNIFLKRFSDSNKYQIILSINGKEMNIQAYLDSGNLLEMNQIGINVINSKLLSNINSDLLVGEKKIKTASGFGLMKIYKADYLKIVVHGGDELYIKNPYIGGSECDFGNDIQMLLSKKIFC